MIESLIPDKLDFYNPLHFDSIHGLSHIIRVMFNSVIVSKLINVNTIPYLISSSIHDIRRRNDNQDLGHGFRAKRYFLENMKKFSAFNLSEQDITIIEYVCQYHETDYENIPQPVLEKYKKYIDIFKACDALDRFRQPKEKWWCNPRYVALKEAHGLIKICRKFTIESEKFILESGNIKESIFKTARLLFL